jgi:hypothetical protein
MSGTMKASPQRVNSGGRRFYPSNLNVLKFPPPTFSILKHCSGIVRRRFGDSSSLYLVDDVAYTQ